MSKLMVSVSGIRGVVGETLTPDVLVKYTLAFAELVGFGTIVVGKDSRVTGDMVENIVVGTLLSAGCDVIKLGIIPTPTCEIMVVEKKASGGIIITASHNPQQWNALKMVESDGMFLRKDSLEKLKELYNKKEHIVASWDKIGTVKEDNSAMEIHVNKMLSLKYIDVPKIKERKFKVVLDTNHGAGGNVGKYFLEKLNCEIVPMGLQTDGNFEHGLEPIPQNLESLCKRVKETSADVGFAVDPDGDRLAIVSNNGVTIGEEYTMAIAVKCMLEKNKGAVTVNLSTSSMSEQIAKSLGCDFFRTSVGEINVSSQMKENGSIIGGEGNGGVILPDVHYGRDALSGMIMCLQYMADTKKSVAEIVDSIPKFYMIKERVELGGVNPDKVVSEIEKRIEAGEINRDDGLRITWKDYWVHVRKSNTEPILRIILETSSKEKSEKLLNDIKEMIQ